MIPLSALNHYLFCPRRAAFIHAEGIFHVNQHTLRGDIVHEHSDLPGYEVAKGVTLLRALPVWSDRLGLNGKCDIVEQHADGNLFPVEFKLGKRRQWSNDDAQLCAQALCLEEMFGLTISRGAIFHADSKRRREVDFTEKLRMTTLEAIKALHALLNNQDSDSSAPTPKRLPPAILKPACEECSLFDICLPKATSAESHAVRLNRDLFKT